VKLALELLHQELLTTMGLCGCTSIKDISRAHVARLRPDGAYEPFPPRRVTHTALETRPKL
jgi:isopentenyl diphosphate isomerase/L-lactate dehydrogenase-like FMN-dependent dehydrogenase